MIMIDHYLWFHVAAEPSLFLLEALIHVAAKAKDLGLPGGRFPYDSPVDVDRWIKTVMAVMVFFLQDLG